MDGRSLGELYALASKLTGCDGCSDMSASTIRTGCTWVCR
jgi:hypothetical protein